MTDASRAIDDGWRELFALIDRAAEVHGDVVALRARMLAAAPSPDELERQVAAAGDCTTLPDAGDALATVAHHACQWSPKESHPGSPIWSQCGDVTGPLA